MKKSTYLIAGLAFFMACKTAPKEIEEGGNANPKTPVEVVSVKYGSIDDELSLSATTIYLKRSLVTATIPAFVTKVYIKLGDAVTKGMVLYELESKERRSLGGNISKLDSSLASFGLIKIKASASGVITTLDKQQPGDYVLEGTLLCTIAESGDLAFQVNVPYEFTAFTKLGTVCNILLPDNSKHDAKFTRSLTSMNAIAQTQTILAKTSETLFLPEGMIVKVSVKKNEGGDKQVLPKSCVLSDEMMKQFWVMKLINDSIAVKITVIAGNKNEISTEILEPKFDPNDKIISVGNYGLPDTAFIRISK